MNVTVSKCVGQVLIPEESGNSTPSNQLPTDTNNRIINSFILIYEQINLLSINLLIMKCIFLHLNIIQNLETYKSTPN